MNRRRGVHKRAIGQDLFGGKEKAKGNWVLHINSFLELTSLISPDATAAASKLSEAPIAVGNVLLHTVGFFLREWGTLN